MSTTPTSYAETSRRKDRSPARKANSGLTLEQCESLRRAVPEDLQQLPQWVLWRDVNGRKLPIQVSGRPAKSNDPSTWTSFEGALRAASDDCAGIGFVFHPDDGLAGIDLDGCRDPTTGQIESWASAIIEAADSYCEISPSGTGVKIFGFCEDGVGPGIRVTPEKVDQVSEKSPGIELYFEKRFFAVTGDALQGFDRIGDMSAAAEAIRHQRNKQPAQSAREQLEQHNDLMRRAEDYLSKVPAAPEGQRNATAFRLAGNIRSMTDDVGNRLPPDQIFEAITDWNARNDTPLEEEELRAAVESSIRNGSARPDKPPSGDEIHLEPDEPASERTSFFDKNAELPIDLTNPAGILGVFTKFLSKSSEYVLPELSLAAAICFVSAVTGRRIADYRDTRPNFYAVCIAPSGSGKERPRKVLKQLLARSGVLGPERYTSGAAIARQLQHSPTTLSLIDEFGQVLRASTGDKASVHLQSVLDAMLSVYTSPDGVWVPQGYADRSKTATIDQPHLTLLGSTTPDPFFGAITGADVGTGLVGRFMAFQSPACGYVARQKVAAEVQPPPQELAEFVRRWQCVEFESEDQTAAHIQRIGISAEALQRIERHIDGIAEHRQAEQRDSPYRATIWSRAAEKSSKLALIHAVGRDAREIGLEDVNWAIAVVNFLTRRLIAQIEDRVAENSVQKRVQRVLEIVESGGPVILRNELTRKTQWLTRREREDAIATLRESGQIFFMTRQPSKGRPPVGFTASLQEAISSGWQRQMGRAK